MITLILMVEKQLKRSNKESTGLEFHVIENNVAIDFSDLDLDNNIFNYPSFNDMNINIFNNLDTNIFNDLDINIYNKEQNDKLSKKIGCQWQLNAGFCKSENAVVINKLVEKHNHLLTPYRKEFAPSLHSFSQEVFDAIKFLTQECNLGVKAQHWYLSKKFSNQPLYDHKIEKYLTSKLVFVQNTQIFQSVLYWAFLVKTSNNLVSPPKAHEYSEGYLEDEYDALQASLETIIKMVNHENILEIWRVTLPITGTTAEHKTVIEMNQVISICRPDIYQSKICKNITQKQKYGIAKSGLKFAIDNDVDITQIENPKKLKHKGHPKGSNSVQQDSLQDLNIEQKENSKPKKCANVKTDNNNIKLKLGTRHCKNCYGTGHYNSTCKFPKNHF
ncbi:17401_t:CDS:2, partial [Dentiscutata erythropus]